MIRTIYQILNADFELLKLLKKVGKIAKSFFRFSMKVSIKQRAGRYRLYSSEIA
jgi:hypothetical protein